MELGLVSRIYRETDFYYYQEEFSAGPNGLGMEWAASWPWG